MAEQGQPGRRRHSRRRAAAAVFVVGSPRSGTTFLGRALGQMDGFVDAGELLADRLPRLYDLPPDHAAVELRDGLREAGYPLDRRTRPVIHTPEMVFVAAAVQAMEPTAVIVQSVRDGRDVVASLIDQGWFAARRPVSGDPLPAAPLPGDAPRYWTERSRAKEFAAVSEARRAAWLWRRAVLAGLRRLPDPARALTLRYEEACADIPLTTERLSALIGVDRAEVAAALAQLRADSVGRWRSDLSALQLQDVYREAGEVLRFLGFADLPVAFDSELAAIAPAPASPLPTSPLPAVATTG